MGGALQVCMLEAQLQQQAQQREVLRERCANRGCCVAMSHCYQY